MYYELYVDSLFLINFCMNLYLLAIVNRAVWRTATRKRLISGAAAGAALYIVPFLLSGPVWLKVIIGFVPGAVIMILITFQVKNLKAFFKIAEKLMLYTFLTGGILLFLIRRIPGVREALVNVMGIMVMGAFIFLYLSYRRERKDRKSNLCRVTLITGGAQIALDALLDTGNSLREPISGKPVSILDKAVFEELCMVSKNDAMEEIPAGYRVIPYHSIGKKRGILQGYLIPEMIIESEGITKICKDVYVGISEDITASDGVYKMILNPQIFGEQQTEVV